MIWLVENEDQIIEDPSIETTSPLHLNHRHNHLSPFHPDFSSRPLCPLEKHRPTLGHVWLRMLLPCYLIAGFTI